MEKYLTHQNCQYEFGPQREKKMLGYRKKVWVVGNCQLPVVNSWVVTLVQVMHSETIWPARRDRTKLLVHMLKKRRHVL